MPSASENFTILNKATGSYPFTLLMGGGYEMVMTGTFSTGAVLLDILGPDGSTYIEVGEMTGSAPISSFSLPPGSFKFVVPSDASDVSISLTRMPG